MKQQLAVIPGPLWVVGHGLVDEVTSYVDDVRTFVVDLGGMVKRSVSKEEARTQVSLLVLHGPGSKQ